jgi:flagellar basal-body rod protein FlgB
MLPVMMEVGYGVKRFSSWHDFRMGTNMDYSNVKLMQMMATKMAYLSERQDVLAQNVANADTPGYKAKQLRELDFERLALSEARRLKLRASSSGESMLGSRPTQDFRRQEEEETHETTPVENNIALEEQMAMVADNKLQYDTVTNLYTKTSEMFKVALGQGRS